MKERLRKVLSKPFRRKTNTQVIEHQSCTLLMLPLELQHMLMSIDANVERLWPLLCYDTAITSRFDDCLEKHGVFIKRDYLMRIAQKADFKNGILQGPCTEYYADGSIYKTLTYKDGILQGECKIFYPGGTLQQLEFYKNGELDGEFKKWHGNGRQHRLAFYVNGKVDGKTKDWYSNGQVCQEQSFKNGLLFGQSVAFFNDGQVMRRSHWRNGLLHGETTDWKNGAIVSSSIYKDGQRLY